MRTLDLLEIAAKSLKITPYRLIKAIERDTLKNVDHGTLCLKKKK